MLSPRLLSALLVFTSSLPTPVSSCILLSSLSFSRGCPVLLHHFMDSDGVPASRQLELPFSVRFLRFLLGLLRASNIVPLPLLAMEGFMARSPSNAFQN
ncbi:hypothetical protein KC19_VG160900 [Ceratodon purpureus]|uniref:Secreted protein n=1 Tax=Ceratodon purpureus TaxID=3225 RepID=A0A8T0HRS2_CERPU|nr:hypothetical protein KC19_VG160900 [Ceratodon purpureus]